MTDTRIAGISPAARPLDGMVIALASGGTGGHMFPAVALAQALVTRGAQIVFFTDARAARYTDGLDGVKTMVLPAGGLAGKGLRARLSGMMRLAMGTWQARAILAKTRPAAVVGFGGYASVPATLSAKWLGIPFALHEQNAVLGRANRMVAAHARHIATSFAHVRLLDPAYAAKTIHTGNPIRRDIAILAQSPYHAPDENNDQVDGQNGPIRLLVTGGSQGARVLSEILPAALVALPAELRSRLIVTQQVRAEDMDAVERAYAGSGIDTRLAAFIGDMPDQLRDCHLVIARSGASTVAELTAAGRPAILVPLPGAIDDHQRHNALQMQEAGGAWVMTQDKFTIPALCEQLTTLLGNPDMLRNGAMAARNAGRPDADEKLADMVCAMLGLPGATDTTGPRNQKQGDTQ